jgi:hypothetical protein
MYSADIHGTWELLEFLLERSSGQRDIWGTKVRGYLFYASTGHMSVSINRDPSPNLADGVNQAQANFDAGLFYAGTYKLDGSIIVHQVTVASDLRRVGKEMLRFASLDGDTLTLKSPKEDFGTAVLTWRRLK